MVAALCISFAGRPAASQRLESENESATDSNQRRPREVKPPRKPIEQGFRVGLLFGINILPWAEYNYTTRIALPSGEQPQYSGVQDSPGLTAFAGGSVTFPGALRRLTVGANVNAGGLYSVNRAVIPEGAITPFPRQNLQDALRFQHSLGQAWHPSFSPYVEHDIWRLAGNKVRLGYQYWRQSGAYQGTFFPGLTSGSVAGYDVQMKHSSHLIRFSVNNHLYSEDVNGTTNPSQGSNRKSGLLKQMGVSVGTHKTIMIFFAIGPVWEF